MKVRAVKSIDFRKILILIFITICFSNCTSFRFLYGLPQAWLLIGGLSLFVAYRNGFTILKTSHQLYLLLCSSFLISYLFSPFKNSIFSFVLIFVVILLISGIRFSEEEYLFFINGCYYTSLFIATTIIVEVFYNTFNVEYLWFLGTIHPSDIYTLTLHKKNEILMNAYSGVAFEKADAAYYMAIGLSVLLSKYKQSQNLSKVDILQGGLLVAALILTGKRMMVLCMIVVFLIVFSLTTQNNKILKIIGLAVVSFLAIIVLSSTVPAISNLLDRFSSAAFGEDAALAERYVKWLYAIKLFLRRPICGYGFGSYNEAARLVGYKASFYAHNIYIQLLSDTGMLGLFSFILFAGYNLFRSWKVLRTNCIKMVNSNADFVLIFSLSIQLIILIYGISGNSIFYSFQLFIYLFSTFMANRSIVYIENNVTIQNG